MEFENIIILCFFILLFILVAYFRRKYLQLKSMMHLNVKDKVNFLPTNDENQKPEIENLLQELQVERTKRLELEKRLHIKETQFELALEENNDGLWDWNIATNEVYLSPRRMWTLGFKNGEIEQKDCLLQNFLHPDDWEQALQKLEILLSGQNPNYENIIRVRAKSGDWLWLYDRGKVIEWDATGKPLRIIGTYTNLTEKKRQELIQQIQPRIGIIVGATGDFNRALSGLLEEVFKIGEIDFGGVYIINHRTRDIELVCHQGLAAEIVVHVRKFASESPLAKLISIGNSVFDHPERLQNLPNFRYSDTELQMVAIIPVKFENEVVAALMLGSQHLKSFSPADQLLLEAIAGQLGGVIARVRTEKTLKESRENFQRLFNTFKDFLLIFDIKGQIIRANPAVSSRLGYSPEELEVMNLHDLYVFEKSDEFYRLLTDTEKNDLVELSLPMRTAAGTFIPTETRITQSEWNDQPVFWGISRDISERQKAEIALKKRDRILSAVSTAAFILLKIRKFDQAIQEVIKILGTNIQSSRIFLFQNSADASRPLLQFEWYADEKFKGENFIASPTYQDAGLSRWSALLSNGNAIVSQCDEFPAAESQWLRSLQIKTVAVIPIFDREHWWGFIRFDDCEKQTEFSVAEVDALRSVAGLLGSAIERRKIEDELRKYRGHLEELVQIRTNELSEVNAELKAFAYSVSHDLRAPLRAMYGFSQVLIEDYGSFLDERGQEYAKRIESAAKRMENLIQDLLNYSSLSRTEIHFQPINMNQIFANILLQLKEEIQQCQAQIEIIKPLPEVIGHQLILEQIFSNLLTNAIKFVPPDRVPYIKIWAEQDLKTAIFWVADNGIGIERDYHDRIFKVFERLHSPEEFPGTGIGLAIVRRGVDRLGGTVGLESTPDLGTKFWIRLSRVIK